MTQSTQCLWFSVHHSRLVFSGNSANCVTTLNPCARIVCGLPPHHTTLCEIRRKITSTECTMLTLPISAWRLTILEGSPFFAWLNPQSSSKFTGRHRVLEKCLRVNGVRTRSSPWIMRQLSSHNRCSVSKSLRSQKCTTMMTCLDINAFG